MKISFAPKRGYASCESKKCLPKGRQRAIHLLLKVRRIEAMSEAPRAGGPVRVGLQVSDGSLGRDETSCVRISHEQCIITSNCQLYGNYVEKEVYS